MNSYLDTSCLAKLYIDEPDSDRVREMVLNSDIVTTSSISFVEIRSMVSRRLRERLLTAAQSRRILDVFESDWSHMGKIPPEPGLLKSAGALLMKHPLRSLDAIQLASALAFRKA